MSSLNESECPICENALGRKTGTITTDCQHTFHRKCAQKRLEESQRGDCRVCRKESAIGDALERSNTILEEECQICEKKLDDGSETVTTDCQHTFHRECAQQRLEKSQRSDCRVCQKKSAIGDALERLNPILEGECQICEDQLGRKNETISTDCQHIFHRKCAQKRLEESQRGDCRVCRKESAIEKVLQCYKPSLTVSKENVKPNEYDDSHSKNESASVTSKEKKKWECQKCMMENNSSVSRCQSCGLLRNASLINSVMIAENIDRNQTDYSSNKSLTSKTRGRSGDQSPSSIPYYATDSSSSQYRSRSRSPQKPPVILYIKDLPPASKDDFELANKIRHRIDTNYKIQVLSIRCYSKFGIGSIEVSNNQMKDYLIRTVGYVSIDSQVGSPMISFVDTPELVSCIVINVIDKKNMEKLPNTNEIISRWAELFRDEKPHSCEQVNIQFPNIFRIITSFNESYISVNQEEFAIKDRLARIYFGADCSYFEDLPKSIGEKRLREEISRTIGLENIPLSALHIELNEKSRNACIIACGIARKWASKSFIYVDSKPISKKDDLTRRLLLSDIPEGYNIANIVEHPNFDNQAKKIKHRGTNLILEIFDKSIFDKCMLTGVLTMNDGKSFLMKNYIASNDPEELEIDADTWYESEMFRYKPDIMQFIGKPDHEIFLFQWNPQLWLKQFEPLSPQDPMAQRNNNASRSERASYDARRHRLRVTVMLNTIAVIKKKKYTVGNREIELNLDKNLQTIVYNHQSKLKSGGKLSSIQVPYPRTKVEVVNEDCLVVYEKLVKSGKKPLLLNMANAASPGGGYRKGDGAQEENIFRRSDYFRSLDASLDDIQEEPCERFYCTSQGEIEILFDSQKLYPMNNYGAIYTSGLTVFRQVECTGYEYMKEPLHGVCALAMAAYRQPQLIDENTLDKKEAVGMRKKIENIFSIGYHHNHDCLVLSALGCGAFKNPPNHIAKLFHSVIEQYAGFFESIVFAIIDDHNTGASTNPNGNYLPFKRELDSLVVEPMLKFMQPHTKFGPYRILSDGSSFEDIYIYDLPPCQFAAKCQDMYDSKHARQFSHPPFCVESLNHTCKQDKNMVHMSSFVHRIPCEYGAKCRTIDDPSHNQEFEHPLYCRDGGFCCNTSDDHEKSFRHVPMCTDAHKCKKYRAHDKDHCSKMRHCKPRCQYAGYCADFHNRGHIEDFEHPFRTPCPFTPYHCAIYIRFEAAKDKTELSYDDQQHCETFAHICRFGRSCTNNDLFHEKKYIHIARLLCSYGSKCTKIAQEDHLNSFTHPNIRDIRILCKHGDECRYRQDYEHFARYRHGLIFGDSAVVHYCNLNQNINFVQNQNDSITKINDYAREHKWDLIKLELIPVDILNWIRTIQPIHRCSPEIFESILLHGHAMGREYMKQLKKPEFVANFIVSHIGIRQPKISEAIYKHLKNYVMALVAMHYKEANFLSSKNIQNLLTQSSCYSDVFTFLSETVKKEDVFLTHNLGHQHLKSIREKTIEIAMASLKLFQNPAGIGYSKDEDLETNKHIFSILGPHKGVYYGNVVIVFKRDILHHPDANFTTQAATSFASGRIGDLRPWLKDNSTTDKDRIDLFHKSKLHASIPGYEYATALELIATTSNYFKKKKLGMKVSLDKIIERWRQVDSHFVIEAHLPQLIPLDYIEHIYMPESIFASLTGKARETVDSLFKDSITIPQNKTDDEYNAFVFDDLLKKFNTNGHDSILRPVHGAVMTIKATNFEDHFLLPLTISQAFTQYQTEHSKVPANGTIYIYWQIMNGDMMLTLSNEQIDTSQTQKDLKSLICYIAPKPKFNDSNYHEQISYLNSGHPFQHQRFLQRNHYEAKSTNFYLACNTDDLMTFCLEINRSNGIVTLSHAGSNSIYNHEKISCTFPKKTLDLTKLEYIYVSAGAQTLPIRNFIVCFEKQHDLHATFDTKFHRTTKSANMGPKIGAQVSKPDDEGDASSSKASDAPTPSSLHRLKNYAEEKIKQAKAYVLGDDNSKMKQCPDGIYCLIQFSENGPDHNSQYLHPCRFAETCKDPEPNLTHESHQVPNCPLDKKCDKLIDPLHRSQFRHTGWPYFLIPCRDQDNCKIKAAERHLKIYSHGERVFETKQTEQPQAASVDQTQQNDRNVRKTDENKKEKIQCKHAEKCRDINDPNHCRKYSHPVVAQSNSAPTIRCKWVPNCRDHSPTHRAKFLHPSN